MKVKKEVMLEFLSWALKTHNWSIDEFQERTGLSDSEITILKYDLQAREFGYAEESQ